MSAVTATLLPPAPRTDEADAALASSLAAALLPHFKASLQQNDPESEAVLALESLKRALTGPPVPPPPPLAVDPVPAPTTPPVCSVTRVITCTTYLRRLHVTAEMSETLLPDMSLHLPRDTMRAQPNQNFFKRQLQLVDPYNYPHAVTYECLVSSGQRHARLSAGWGTLMRRLHVAMGDTVVLELYGDRNEGVLHVRVERGYGRLVA